MEKGGIKAGKMKFEMVISMEIKNLKHLFILVILLICINSLSAQSNINFDMLRQAYPDQNAVLVKNNQNITIEVKDTGLSIVEDNYFEMAYLTDRVNHYANKAIFYSDFSDVVNIEAKTITSESSGSKTLKVLNVFTKDDFGNGIFYGSGKKKEFVFPGVQKGAHSILSYKENIKDPHFITPFYFASYVPVVNSEFSVTFPKTVKIRYKLLGTDTANIVFSMKPGSKNITYTWTVKNLPEMNNEESAPPISMYSPHIVVYIDEYTLKGKTIKVLGTIDDLYNWYYSLTHKVNNKDDGLLKSITDSLIAGTKNDDEKAKRIFYWV